MAQKESKEIVMMTDRERNTFEEFAKSLEEDFLKKIVNGELTDLSGKKLSECDVNRIFYKEQQRILLNTMRIEQAYYKTLNEIARKLKELTNKEWDYKDDAGRWIHHKGETRCKFISHRGKEFDTYLRYKDRIDIKQYFIEVSPVFAALMKRERNRERKVFYMRCFYEILSKYLQEYKIIEIFTRYSSSIGFTLSQEELIEMRDIYIEISETKTSIEVLNIDFGIKEI